jgi:hypothetical protein
MKAVLAVLGVILMLPVLLFLAIALGPAALVILFIVACAVPVLLVVELGSSRRRR